MEQISLAITDAIEWYFPDETIFYEVED
jgi:hypothetical protein